MFRCLKKRLKGILLSIYFRWNGLPTEADWKKANLDGWNEFASSFYVQSSFSQYSRDILTLERFFDTLEFTTKHSKDKFSVDYYIYGRYYDKAVVLFIDYGYQIIQCEYLPREQEFIVKDITK